MEIFNIPGSNIYFGARPGYKKTFDEDIKTLRSNKCDILVSFSDDMHHPLDKDIQSALNPREFVHIETTDHLFPRHGSPVHVLSIEKIQTVVSTLEPFAKDPDAKVYMYCGSGEGRSQCYALAYYMKQNNCSMLRAAQDFWGSQIIEHTREITFRVHALYNILLKYAKKESLPEDIFPEEYSRYFNLQLLCYDKEIPFEPTQGMALPVFWEERTSTPALDITEEHPRRKKILTEREHEKIVSSSSMSTHPSSPSAHALPETTPPAGMGSGSSLPEEEKAHREPPAQGAPARPDSWDLYSSQTRDSSRYTHDRKRSLSHQEAP